MITNAINVDVMYCIILYVIIEDIDYIHALLFNADSIIHAYNSFIHLLARKSVFDSASCKISTAMCIPTHMQRNFYISSKNWISGGLINASD